MVLQKITHHFWQCLPPKLLIVYFFQVFHVKFFRVKWQVLFHVFKKLTFLRWVVIFLQPFKIFFNFVEKYDVWRTKQVKWHACQSFLIVLNRRFVGSFFSRLQRFCLRILPWWIVTIFFLLFAVPSFLLIKKHIHFRLHFYSN